VAGQRKGERLSSLACTRRDALGLTLGALVPACRSKSEPAPAPAPSDEGASDPNDQSSAPFGGLEVTSGGDLGEGERGGTAVVLLHGFGAAGDDLVSLARELAQPRTRYVVPAAPLTLSSGGRAWWQLKQKPTYDAEQELVVERDALLRARAAVQGVLATIRERHAPEQLFLAGFSQGAMLALDVALQKSSGVDRVGVLSGALTQATAGSLAKRQAKRPRVFVSHGRQDRVLRFEGAEHLVERLKTSDYAVTFRAFAGGHEIPPEVRDALRDFFA
jgi:phospholipase/carboxylesterase